MEVIKVLGAAAILGLACALGADIGAGIALRDVSATTPALMTFILRVFDSGICYLLFPVGAVALAVSQLRGLSGASASG